MFDLVMFDLDGTLVDTAPEISDAVNDALRELELRQAPERVVCDWIGHGTAELMTKAYAWSTGWSSTAVRDAGVMDAVMPMFSRFYAERCGTRSRLFPEVAASLARLRAMDVRLALVTNKETRFTESVLAAHALRPYFDPIVTGDLLLHKKPHPMPLEYCISRHKVRRERALFVGDSDIDIAAARNAGIACWAVPYGYNHGAPVAQDAPDRLIPNLGAVCDALRPSLHERTLRTWP
jgi:phosphoglycolate phosphatase